MSNDDFELSRRKALAALGTIGVASAGAGLGTSAYFSDQETFENNRLVAGELDLKMDWEEHYSDWSADESDDGQGGSITVLMEEPEEPDLYRRFPAGATDSTIGDHGLWVPRDEVPQFMDNTAIDSFPDTDDNGTAEFPVDDMADDGLTPCEMLAQVGADDDGLSTYTTDDVMAGRTDGPDTRLGDDSPAPLINLTDVKPGDFGEVTFSTHLCGDPGNPGYLWMNMPGGLTESENGVTEPEADDPNEDDSPGDTETSGELAETIQTALWYDPDCDNLPDRGGQNVDLMAIADVSGSIDSSEMADITEAANSFVEELPTDGSVHAGFMTFTGPGEAVDSPFEGINLQKSVGPLDQFFVGNDPNNAADVGGKGYLPDSGVTAGSTPMPAALYLAREILNSTARSGSQKAILLVTDGGPDYPSGGSGVPYQAGGFSYTPAHQSTNPTFGDGTSTEVEQDETIRVANLIDSDGIALFTTAVGGTGTAPNFIGPQSLTSFLANSIATTPTEAFDATVGSGGNINAIAQEIGGRIASIASTGDQEKIIFRGTLGELATELTANDGRGIPLDSNRDTSFDEFDDPENDGDRDCFLAGATYCFGFSWWLPLDHGNEVQSDSASFDIGFYTEQCRHNDGSGMNNEQVTPSETDA